MAFSRTLVAPAMIGICVLGYFTFQQKGMPNVTNNHSNSSESPELIKIAHPVRSSETPSPLKITPEPRVAESELNRKPGVTELEPAQSERDKIIALLHKILPEGEVLPENEIDWFGLLSEGKQEWLRDKIDNPEILEVFDHVAEKLGPMRTRIRLNEFYAYSQKHLVLVPSTVSDPSPVTKLDSETEKLFHILDRNGDHLLSAEEMPKLLRVELKTWDADSDGKINPAEFHNYILDRLRKGEHRTDVEAEILRGAAAGDPNKTPQGLPGWFFQLDLDHDGQIGLYEWRSIWSALEFEQLDLNQDGFLTAEELLHYLHDPEHQGKALNELIHRKLTKPELHAIAVASRDWGLPPSQQSGRVGKGLKGADSGKSLLR
ncbi:hypothetical protein KIH39_09575 [Telmatocola sphagniphila]|uniref:EF-hand domain-containing protein n=1 Tax=Telmatocola sphagniphila TaxID=1123043 RepID=A0A8E6F046_9BACT|nr:hypothetical protein [Telmatocola sphagniphila]QVL34136.1 hypothetical protein KIH39_09575 [Telmatocola sphagniphila]